MTTTIVGAAGTSSGLVKEIADLVRCIMKPFVAGLAAVLQSASAAESIAAERAYHRIVDGVSIYVGLLPAELVRGHPRSHSESDMHGGAQPGESHLVVALFDDKTGDRIVHAELTATVMGPNRSGAKKKLEPMLVAGSVAYGGYLYMPGPGPYRIVLRIRLPEATRDIEAVFDWARS